MKNNHLTTLEMVTLKEYLESEIKAIKALLTSTVDERDRLYSTQFKASEIAVNAALAAQEKAVAAAFLASEKAIVKAEDAQKDYNQRSNEFRGQLDDQAKTLIPRLETVGLFKNVDDKLAFTATSFEGKLQQLQISNEKVFDSLIKDIASLRESRSEGQGKGTGLSTGWITLIQLLGIISTIAFLYALISGHIK